MMKRPDPVLSVFGLCAALAACLLLSGCASAHKTVVGSPLPRDVPGNMLPSEGIESVRYTENVKAYPVNRYVDPANRGIMHERHTLYRVETSARWNLRPNQPIGVPMGPRVAVRNSASNPPPLPGELNAELARQKEATRTVIAQGQRLGSSIDRLQGALDQTAATAEEQRKLQAELLKTQSRVEQLEKDRAEKSASGGTDVPTPTPLPQTSPANGQKPESFESP